MNAADRRKIEVAHRDFVVLIFLHRLAQRIDLLLLVLRRGRPEGRDRSESEYGSERTRGFCELHHFPPYGEDAGFRAGANTCAFEALPQG